VGGDGVVKVWDPPSRTPQDLTSPLSAAEITTRPFNSYALTWADDGKHLSVVASDGDLRTLDVTSKAVVATRRLVPRDVLVRAGLMQTPIRRFLWGPGGKLLASVEGVNATYGPAAGGMKIWDGATGKEMFSLRSAWSVVRPAILQGPDYPAGCSPAWDRSGRRLALGDADGMIRTWDVGSARRAVRTPFVNVFSAGFAWSADSRHLLCSGDVKAEQLVAQDKQRRDWQARSPGRLTSLPPPPPAALGRLVPAGLAWTDVVGRPDQPQVQVCDAVTGEAVRTLRTGVQPEMLAESPDGKWLAWATNAGLLQLAPAGKGEPVVTLEGTPGGGASAAGLSNSLLSWSRDGNHLAYSTPQQTTVRLWDPGDTHHPVRTLEHGKPLQSLAWSPDGQRLASAGDGTVKVWDVGSGQVTSTFAYFVKREPLRFSPGEKTFASSILAWCDGGKQLAVAGEDETIKVWDVEARKELAALHGHPSTEAWANHNVVSALAASPDGKRLASASPDGTFLVWDTATWQEVLTLRPGSAGPFAREILPSHAGTLAWSPDGRQLGFFGKGNVTIWDATPEDDKLGQ
jgi:WD40 repeat protein